jgi:hypothetical protein
VDQEQTEKAIKNAWIAGIVSGSITLLVTIIAAFGIDILGFSLWNLLDVLLIFGLTFGIYRKSRVSAVSMFVYFVASKIFIVIETGKVAGIPLAIVFGYYFFQGIRGTFAWHQSEKKEIPMQEKRPTFKNKEEYERWKQERMQQGVSATAYPQPSVQQQESGMPGWAKAVLIVVAIVFVGIVMAGAITAVVMNKKGAAQTASAWQEFSHAAGKFTVLMPAAPTEQQQVIQTAAGPITMYMFFHELKGGQSMYGVIYSDYPALVANADPQKVLDGGRDGAVADMKGRLVQEQNITIQGHPGRELHIEVPQGMVKARIYLVGVRLYQALSVGAKEMIRPEDTEKFFSSFRLAI